MHIQPTERANRTLIWVVLPLVAYTVIALIMTWPLVARMQSHIAGVSYGDSYMMLRQAWGAREALLDGRNPLEQTLFAYPDGFTSTMMWSTPLRWVPVTLLSFVVPPVMAFNLWLIVTLILNGTTAYWLGMELTDRNPWAALLGGLVFMAFPNMQGHLGVGHIDVLAMYGLPLFALYAWRVLRKNAGWRAALWGSVWLAVACLGLTSQIIYNVLPVAGFLALYHLLWDRARLVRRDLPFRDQPWIKFGVMIVLGGLILLIFFGPLMTDAGQAEINRISETGRVTFSADPLAYASPSIFGPLDDLGLVPGYARDVLGTNSTEGSAYLGVIPLLLVIAGLMRSNAARPWLLVALGAAIFSLGPLLKWRDAPVVLHFEDVESYVTLPWAALQDLPVLEATRTPGRFNGATALAWAALVSVGASVVFSESTRRFFVGVGLALPRAPQAVPLQDGMDSEPDSPLLRVERGPGGEVKSPLHPMGRGFRGGAYIVVIILAAIILLEYTLFWPFPTLDARQPDYFRQLTQADDVRAVLNVPINDPLVSMQAMRQQMIHGKPMIAGQLYRRTPQDPAVLAVLDRAVRQPFLLEDDGLLVLSAANVDRVIVHKRFLPDDSVLVWLESFLGAPEYADDQIAAFVVPQLDELPRHSSLLWNREYDEQLAIWDGVQLWLVLEDEREWYFYTPAPFVGALYVNFKAYTVPRRIGVWVDDRLSQAFEIGTQLNSTPITFQLEPGFHTLRVKALDDCFPYPFTLTCLGGGDCARLDSPICISAFAGFMTAQPFAQTLITRLDVSLDNDLRLDAFRQLSDEQNARLDLDLFWSADRALPSNYALFVHLSDPETGEPVAQYDGFPLIPTDEWEDDTRWVSDVTIPILPNLPPGEYAINVGWFDPETGERLAVLAEPSDDQPWANANMIHLGMVTIE